MLNKHNSLMTLEVVRLAMQSRLGIMSLPSYTSQALLPLKVSCFKTFKTIFKKIKDSYTLSIKNKHMEKPNLVNGHQKL